MFCYHLFHSSVNKAKIKITLVIWGILGLLNCTLCSDV